MSMSAAVEEADRLAKNSATEGELDLLFPASDVTSSVLRTSAVGESGTEFTAFPTPRAR